MTEFILGASGSGKTACVTERILTDLADGKRVLLLVPEQAAVRAEAMLCAEAQTRSVPQTDLEILNFRRLCNRVFRQYGGLSYNAVTAGAKALLVWEALFAVSPYLKYYKNETEDAQRFIPLLLSQMNECKSYGISAGSLDRAAAECRNENPHLADKLTDLALIFSEYERLLSIDRSDPDDEPALLEETLSQHLFFNGYHLYIDGFVGFTPQEYRILFYAFRQAESVTLTFCHLPTDRNFSFQNADRELRKLIGLCGTEEPKITYLGESRRFAEPELSYLEKNLWSPDADLAYQEDAPAIRTVTAHDPYEEAEFVANDILRSVRNGAEYRDFAIVARHIENEIGILDAVFEKYGLPCRIARRIPLSEKPLFKQILGALAIQNRDWRLEDVIRYLRTGLTGIPTDDCDELERYASRWGIFGRRWYDEEDWFMNPDGYTDILTDESRALLKRVNRTRRDLVLPLRKLHELLDGTKAVSEVAEAVFLFLNELALPDQISAAGNDDEIRLWNCLCDALDTMVDIIPDKKVDNASFSGLFELVVSQSDVGTLPAALDEISVGSADRIRADRVRHCYLIGVNEGVFPAACSETGLFSDRDKAVLETYGVVLSPDTDTASINELFRFYTSACLPSHSLTVLCSRFSSAGESCKPSLAFDRIRALFPNGRHLGTEDLPIDFWISTPKASLETAFRFPRTPEGQALRRYYETSLRYASYFNTEKQPIYADEETLTPETVREVFGKDLPLTQSRLEAFASCRFSYESKYLLKLKETGQIDYRINDIGSFVHRILEKFFLSVTAKSNDGAIPPLSDDEIDTLLNAVIEDYLTDIFGRNRENRLTPRALQLFVRLRKNTRLLLQDLLKEFSQSRFTPRFFEMPIDVSGRPGTVYPMKIPLSDGTSAYLYGIADRVDICRKGKDVYVRVIDYKTGKKELNLKDLRSGMNLQLLLYLFSIWKDPTGTFRKSVGCEGQLLPAGVLYCKVKPARITVSPTETSAEVFRKISETLSRTGLLIDDAEVIADMGDTLPKSINKVGDFGHLVSEITQTVTSLAEEIKSGSAHCRPVRESGHDACLNCPYQDFCRNPEALKPAKGGFPYV